MSSNHHITFSSASAEDADDLAAIRIEAMRASLEQVGRFDPGRARARLLAGFEPESTRHIEVDGQRVGFFVVKSIVEGLVLDHLYVRPTFQGQGIGAAVLQIVFAQADAAGLPVKVGALRGSRSNQFYTRHGFTQVDESDFDIYYVRQTCVSRNEAS